MMRFNPFRVSFDSPLTARELRRGRIAATLIGGAAIVFGATSVLALLHANSETINTWSMAQSEPVRTPDQEPATTGAASRDDEPVQSAAIPIPVPAPVEAQTERPTLQADAGEQRQDAKPPQSKRERASTTRKLRRAETRRLRAERRRERMLAREYERRSRWAGRGGERMMRQWAEYPPPSPFGGSQRVIVIPRGPIGRDFFGIGR